MSAARPEDVAAVLRLMNARVPETMVAWVVLRAALLVHESICYDAETGQIIDCLEPAATSLANAVIEKLQDKPKESKG